MGGGFNAVADRSSVSIEHLTDKSGVRVQQVNVAQARQDPLAAGDVIQVASTLASVLPKDRQAKRVHIDGEVTRPGDYVLPPGATLADALNAAGGLTPKAFLFGTEFTRESVRRVQQQNFDRALRDLETETAKSTASRRVASAEEATSLSASENANNRLLERLRQVRPTGRVVLPLTPDTNALPDMVLEDSDRITIPSRGSSVGVFGSVFNTGSFIFSDNRTLNDYLKQAGGPTKGPTRAACSWCEPMARWSAPISSQAPSATAPPTSAAWPPCLVTPCSCPKN
jgi:protein involved in polysaccharide export with SLBB domain